MTPAFESFTLEVVTRKQPFPDPCPTHWSLLGGAIGNSTTNASNWLFALLPSHTVCPGLSGSGRSDGTGKSTCWRTWRVPSLPKSLVAATAERSPVAAGRVAVVIAAWAVKPCTVLTEPHLTHDPVQAFCPCWPLVALPDVLELPPDDVAGFPVILP